MVCSNLEIAMYTVRSLPPDTRCNARGLTLDEAFTRMMALGERHYVFVRTGWAMQLLMTNTRKGEPIFCSHATNDSVARQDIKSQVCRHGLGQFEVVRDSEHAQLWAGEGRML
jgi:hypothetical protein